MLTLYNSLTRKKEVFEPENPENVRMYVCGPTVYDRPHLGNARAVVVYDVLFRLLRHVYGEKHVTYVRNITDVDDKIIEAAKQRGISIDKLTHEVTKWFHDDMAALNCLPPTHEPKATNYIPQMIAMIEKLLVNGHAYIADGHVLFNVTSNADYGLLSGRRLEDLKAGARVEVESYKRHPGDFVLWKPGNDGDPESSLFDSPWSKGRPGWHIECSAMSTDILGETFDIHGGGADLKFPHHENEIAQSCCANPGSEFARLWMHNGFLTVNGEKMSKSLGNFITVRDVIDKYEAQGKGHKAGEIIRLALLSSKYSEPLNWTDKLLEDAEKTLDKWYRSLLSLRGEAEATQPGLVEALVDDLNISKALSYLHNAEPEILIQGAALLGFFQQNPREWLQGAKSAGKQDNAIEQAIQARKEAKKAKDYAKADAIRKELESQGIILEDKRDGTTEWRRG
jgi:cysteinyl-tRNA synthetase